MTKDMNDKRKRRLRLKKRKMLRNEKRKNMTYKFNSFYVICIFVPRIRHSLLRLKRNKRDLHFPPTRKAHIFLRPRHLVR
jgi:hypothetical protein